MSGEGKLLPVRHVRKITTKWIQMIDIGAQSNLAMNIFNF
jgi:hypothetical protein